MKIKLEHNHPIWPWLIEYAAQTLHQFQITRDDGLTPAQRLRGKSAMSARAKIGEKILYKPMKTVKVDKTTPKWRYGVWLGTIEHTSEHIIGTHDGVVKCRAIAPLAGERRFDAKYLEKMVGTPWKPSPNHKGWKIRTNLEEGENEEPEEAEEHYEVPIDYNEDVDEAKRIISESRRAIEMKPGQNHSLHISQADVARYHTTKGCYGCRFAIGQLPYQRGHTFECRK